MLTIAEKMRELWYVLVGRWKSTPCSLHTVLQAVAYRVKYDLKTTLLRKHENNISGKSETLVMLIDHANIFG